MIDTNLEVDESRPLSPVAAIRSPKLDGPDIPAAINTENDIAISDPSTRFELEKTAECDYDINPTELYQAIEAKQWEHAVRIIKDGGSNGKQSGADQAKIWVVRKERDGKLRWRMMPIHASIIFKAPFGIVEAILSVAASTAQYKDDQGMLPLHLAFRNDSTDGIIDELLSAYPSAIEIKDRKGRIPLLCGATRGNANRWRLLSSYTAVAVASEKKRMAKQARVNLDKEMALERKVQEEALRLLKQQNDLKLKEADKMMAAVVEEVKRIQTMSNIMLESVENKSMMEHSLEHQIAALQKEKLTFEEDILGSKGLSDVSKLSGDVLVKYNKFIDDEKKLQEKLFAVREQQIIGPSIPDELMQDTEITTSNITEKVQQLGDVLQDTERKLKDEVGVRAHIQQKLEDTIDKQLVLTEELVKARGDLQAVNSENDELRAHIGITRGQVDDFGKRKNLYVSRIDQLTEALNLTTKQLQIVLDAAAKQKTEVETSFAVRERMLQAIARQEVDMVRAATENNSIADVTRALKKKVDDLLIESPLTGITEGSNASPDKTSTASTEVQ